MRNLLSSFSDKYDTTEQGQYRDGEMAAGSHVILRVFLFLYLNLHPLNALLTFSEAHL